MIYRNMNDLATAMMDADLKDKANVEKFRRLFKVYWDAHNNPPDGVIGVGCITFAEYALINAQQTP